MGTYEARPGAGAGDYTNPSPDHRAGSHQGDGPMGTLTSEMFTIGGDEEDGVRNEPIIVDTSSPLPCFCAVSRGRC